MGAIHIYGNSCIFICVEIKIVVAHIGIISHPQIFYGYASSFDLFSSKRKNITTILLSQPYVCHFPFKKKYSEFFLPYKPSSQRHLRQAAVMMRVNKHTAPSTYSRNVYIKCVSI